MSSIYWLSNKYGFDQTLIFECSHLEIISLICIVVWVRPLDVLFKGVFRFLDVLPNELNKLLYLFGTILMLLDLLVIDKHVHTIFFGQHLEKVFIMVLQYTLKVNVNMWRKRWRLLLFFKTRSLHIPCRLLFLDLLVIFNVLVSLIWLFLFALLKVFLLFL